MFDTHIIQNSLKLIDFCLSASIQPTYEDIFFKYEIQIQKITASDDGLYLRTIGDALGWKLYVSRGIGQLRDSCVRQTIIRNAVQAMQIDNQIILKAALDEINFSLMNIYQAVGSIVILKDKYLIDKLVATENKDTLKAIQALFA